MADKRSDRGVIDRVAEKSVKVDRQSRYDFGQRLKARRSSLDMTQLELAQKVGQTYFTFISQVENGVAKIPTADIKVWATALDIDPEVLAKACLAAYDPDMHTLLFPMDPKTVL
jgi:transcriptional regulator with XRE-family HTH domain